MPLTEINIERIEKIKSIDLCKLNKKLVGSVPTKFVESISNDLNTTATLILTINKFITDENTKRKVEYPLYDEFKNKRYLLLNDKDYYIIDGISEDSIFKTKTITAYKGEWKLNKMPISIEDVGIVLTMEDEIENDIYSLNSLLNEVGWSLGHVDDTVKYENVEEQIAKMRLQESIDDSWLNFINKTISEQFGCIPTFDTVNKTVDLYDLNTFGEEIKICLSKDNYLKSLEKEIESEDLITRLYLQGNEELDIGSVSPTGYSFISNFSYFIDNNEMSEELMKALSLYDEMVEERAIDWKRLTSEKVAKQTELNLENTKWIMSISRINVLKKQIEDYSITEGMEVEESKARVELAKEKDEETILRLTVEDLEEQVGLLTIAIDNINILCKYETCTDREGNRVFDEVLLDELNEFIFIDTYKDDSYVDAEEMLKEGNRILELRSNPTVQMNIDNVNFMKRVVDNNFRLKWNGTLSFGDIVVILDGDIENYYYFVGYDIDYKSGNLSLKISSRKNYTDDTRLIHDWLKEGKKNKSLLDTNRYLFNKVKNLQLNVNKEDIKK